MDRDPTDWLLHGFMTELKGRNMWTKSFSELGMQRYYRKFVKSSVELREYFEEAIPGMSRREKMLLGAMLAKALANDLSKWAKVCLESMFSNVELIPAIINKELPDYLRTGFLGAMIGRPLEEMNAHISNPA